MRLEIEITADDKASKIIDKAFRKSGGSAKKFEKTTVKAFANVQSNIGSLVKKIAAIGAAFAGIKGGFDFAKSVIKTADTFEKLKLTLANIEGSMQKAQASFSWIQDFAAKTPYQLEEVTSAFVKMKTYGIDPLSDDALRVAGDVAAAFQGMGKTIDDVVEALADAQTGEFERLKEFGIKASKQGEQVILRYADAHGQMVEKVVQNNEQVIRSTLLSIWNEKYGGQMQKLSGTWSQMISNIQDNWTRFKQLIAESGFFKKIKSKLKEVLDWSNRMFETGQAQKWAEVIGKSLSFIVDMFYSVFEVVKTVVVGIYNGFIGAFKGIYNFGKKIFTEEGFFESMIDAFIVTVKTMPKVFLKGLGIIAMQVVKWASKLFRPIIVAIEWAVDNMVRAFKRAINSIKKAFMNLRNWIAEKLSFKKEVFGKKIEFQLFDVSQYQPIFDEAETRYISFKQKAEEVNKEQEEMIKNLGRWQSDLWANMKKDYKEALTQIRQSGKAGKLIADGIEKYVSGVEGVLSKVGEQVAKLKAQGVKGLGEIEALIKRAPKTFKKSMDKTVKETKKATKKMTGFWKSFFDTVSKNPFWKKVVEIGKFAWKGIKSFFSAGTKEGETGLIARTKNAITSLTQGATAGGIAGAAAAFLTDQLMQNEKIRNALGKIFNALQKILEPVAEVIAPILEVIADVVLELRPVFKLIAALLKPVAQFIRAIFKVLTKIDDFFRAVFKPVLDAIKGGINAVKSLINSLLGLIKNPGKTIKKIPIVGPVLDTVFKPVKSIFKPVKKLFGGLFHQGGMVPVVAHSGMYLGDLKKDEIPVVAQKGEFVVNRQSTSEYLDILKQINEGRYNPSANITVNIYANKLDRDFVENELAQMLEDLIKRGKMRW